jgi:hypothetical protein
VAGNDRDWRLSTLYSLRATWRKRAEAGDQGAEGVLRAVESLIAAEKGARDKRSKTAA